MVAYACGLLPAEPFHGALLSSWQHTYRAGGDEHEGSDRQGDGRGAHDRHQPALVRPRSRRDDESLQRTAMPGRVQIVTPRAQADAGSSLPTSRIAHRKSGCPDQMGWFAALTAWIAEATIPAERPAPGAPLLPTAGPELPLPRGMLCGRVPLRARRQEAAGIHNRRAGHVAGAEPRCRGTVPPHTQPMGPPPGSRLPCSRIRLALAGFSLTKLNLFCGKGWRVFTVKRAVHKMLPTAALMAGGTASGSTREHGGGLGAFSVRCTWLFCPGVAAAVALGLALHS